jgi:hypothetical protein
VRRGGFLGRVENGKPRLTPKYGANLGHLAKRGANLDKLRRSEAGLFRFGLPNCEAGSGGIEEDAEPTHFRNLLDFLYRCGTE